MITVTRENINKLYLEENLLALNNPARKDFFLKNDNFQNKIMFSNLSKIVDKGNAFIAVGTAHLGENEKLLNIFLNLANASRTPLQS